MQVIVADYKNIRNKIQSGDILACAGTGFFSWLVTRYTKSPMLINKNPVKFTHVGTFVWVFGQLFVVEAVGKVRMVRFSTAYKKYKGELYVIRPSISDDNTKKVPHTLDPTCVKEYMPMGLWWFIEKQLALVGKPYDWTNILRIAAKEGRKVNGKWYCSEQLNYARDYWYTDGSKKKQIMPHTLVEKDPNILWRIRNV